MVLCLLLRDSAGREMLLRTLRRDIARLKTVLAERQPENEGSR